MKPSHICFNHRSTKSDNTPNYRSSFFSEIGEFWNGVKRNDLLVIWKSSKSSKLVDGKWFCSKQIGKKYVINAILASFYHIWAFPTITSAYLAKIRMRTYDILYLYYIHEKWAKKIRIFNFLRGGLKRVYIIENYDVIISNAFNPDFYPRFLSGE